jgi:hypothetical protein
MAFLAHGDQFDQDQYELNAEFARAIEGWQANSGQEENAEPKPVNLAARRMWKNWFKHTQS